MSSRRLSPNLAHMSQSPSQFSATVQLLQLKTKFGQPQSIAKPLKICLCSVASSLCRYKCLEHVWSCAHNAFTSKCRVPSTLLARAQIDLQLSPFSVELSHRLSNPRERLLHVWQFFQTQDFSCGSSSDQLSTTVHQHHATIDLQCYTRCTLARVSISSPIVIRKRYKFCHHVSIATRVERCEFACVVQIPQIPFLKRRRLSSFASHRSQAKIRIAYAASLLSCPMYNGALTILR